MTPDNLRALLVIRSNPRTLTSRGHALLNANIAALLAAGLVVHDGGRAIGYRLTEAGRAALPR